MTHQLRLWFQDSQAAHRDSPMCLPDTSSICTASIYAASVYAASMIAYNYFCSLSVFATLGGALVQIVCVVTCVTFL